MHPSAPLSARHAASPRHARLTQARVALQWLAAPWLTQLVLRIALAVPFWRSGVRKWDGSFRLADTAVALFEDFQLHLPGGPYHYPAPALAALLSGWMEIGLPVLLVLGLGTRFAALGLLLMTGIIQLTVPAGWPLHLTWAAMALGLMAWGPGALAIDRWLGERVPRADGGTGLGA